MIPNELEVTNFLAYRGTESLDFKGLHVVCLAGMNGAGKSSLLEAITWAMWGKARASSVDDLIHLGQERMSVALTFAQADALYKVSRRRRKTAKTGATVLDLESWHAPTESWQVLTGETMKDTQELINEIVQLDYDTFINSAFLVQGKADEFTKKTPAKRKEILSSILGLSVWADYEGRAKDRAKEFSAEILKTEGRLDELRRELLRQDEFDRELETAKTNSEDAIVHLAQAEKALSKIKEADRTVESRLAELKAALLALDEMTQRLHREIAAAQKVRAKAESQADKEKFAAELEKVKTLLSELAPLQDLLDGFQKTMNVHSQEVARLKGINEAMAPLAAPIQKRIETLDEATEPLCPTCQQTLTELDRTKLIQLWIMEIEDQRDQYRENRTLIDSLTSTIAGIREEERGLRAKLGQTGSLERKVGELETALAHADETQERISELDEMIESLEVEEKQATEKHVTAQDERDKLGLQDLQDKEAREDAQKQVQVMQSLKAEADRRVGASREKVEKLASLQGVKNEVQERRERLAFDKETYETLRLAFGKDGIPAMIIETAVPELEQWANELLARMTDGKMSVRIDTQKEIQSGELREALEIIISDDLGVRPYEMYSGGEAFRINFALRIALSRLLARRSGAELRSLFIDEGFGSQDANGREQLVGAINSIQDDFDLIVVITHIDEMKEAFPSRIEVAKTPEGSRIQVFE